MQLDREIDTGRRERAVHRPKLGRRRALVELGVREDRPGLDNRGVSGPLPGGESQPLVQSSYRK